MSSQIDGIAAASGLPGIEVKMERFTLLPKLPIEMRHKIWYHACCFGRNIDLWAQETPSELLPTIDTPKDIPMHFKSHSRPPSVLQASRESRKIGLENFALAFGTTWEHKHEGLHTITITTSARFYVNWSSDLICLVHFGVSESWANLLGINVRDRLVTSLFDHADLQNIKHLSLSFERKPFLRTDCAAKLSALEQVVLYKHRGTRRLRYLDNLILPFTVTVFGKITDERVLKNCGPSDLQSKKTEKLKEMYAEEEKDISVIAALMKDSSVDVDWRVVPKAM